VSDLVVIRPESSHDVGAIRIVTQRAFEGRPYSGGNEQDIIDALRERNALAVSLVAEQGGRICGHVAFSPARPADGAPGWYTLGPVSVEPVVQRQGIGTKLIVAGIDRLRELDAAGCVVVGDPGYYSRFGFASAPHLSPAGEFSDHFMILRLARSATESVVDFHPEFYGKQ